MLQGQNKLMRSFDEFNSNSFSLSKLENKSPTSKKRIKLLSSGIPSEIMVLNHIYFFLNKPKKIQRMK